MPSKRVERITKSLTDHLIPKKQPNAQESAALERLANEVDRALRPVKPRSTYRQTLHQDLVLTAQNKISPYLMIQSPFDRQRLIMIGALIGSAISVIGGIITAMIVRARMLQSRAEQR
jgi:hypothetical protein